MAALGIPLAPCADQILQQLAAASGSAAITALDGATLLGERAMLGGFRIPSRVSAGGGCRLFDTRSDGEARSSGVEAHRGGDTRGSADPGSADTRRGPDGWDRDDSRHRLDARDSADSCRSVPRNTVALNLSRPSDRELLPALFETEHLDPNDDEAIAALVAQCNATQLVARGRSMGLAIAADNELSLARHGESAARAAPSGTLLTSGTDALDPRQRPPRVLDLSALWAGPLASHLLWLAGAEVTKVESHTRPDGMQQGDPTFYELLNHGKTNVVLDFRSPDDRQTLLSLIASSDIVVEAARPRALLQLGLDASEIVHNTPGLTWLTLTAHGATGEPANWVGFGDDCAVAAGLSAALRAATGQTGFVGDAIADPLTGMTAALVAWENWSSGRGARIGVAMTEVVADCLSQMRQRDPKGLQTSLVDWAGSAGQPFPTVQRRKVRPRH
jgi:hypothetical protein